MKSSVLVDSSAILGFYLPNDEWHRPAAMIMHHLAGTGRTLVTTTDIFDEVVTLMRRWGGYATAIRAGNAIRGSKRVRLVPVDDRDRDRAWSLFGEHRTPRLSFTDCTTAAKMERLEIREIFSFDTDFEAFGLTMIPGSV